jgi:2-methylaconitate cis-trans-isomerase PrpF
MTVRIWQANIGKTIIAHVPMTRRRRAGDRATSNSMA